ncbi:uncharacterized protein I303_100107 [Kwoniella dejecticola CBS 10117]|uniref:Gluconate 5-dehydrogenase n=1 Tax=Kwoniella dejecticola CBS 10117 TaxID=1296121 RepID=A0A1A6ADZ8_9TREE|nr:uncharacterized protein I303_00107 [Kwoniella dejecticola CBS 10117]OBR88296.1 hypothetical protein I303_00107 [Kwoniella dejecticola CBS 10117]
MSKDFSLDGLFGVKGLDVLITGGGTGIGLYMAKGFAVNGATTHVVGRRRSVLEEAKATILKLSPSAQIYIHVADISSREEVSRLISSFDKLDVLINCAGIVIPDTPSTHLTPLPELQQALLSSPASTWASTFSVNVESVYFLSVSLLHLLAAAPAGGRIINISSIGSTMSDPNTHQPAYQASKAAVNHLTRLLASKFREHGVRVNAFSPGYFPSQMQDPNNPKSMLARAKDLVPLKRGGEEEDAAGTAIWLASRAGSYVDGQVIPLSGGREWA